jgi:hypothetical protein
MDLLETHADQIDLIGLSENPSIFVEVFDYQLK